MIAPEVSNMLPEIRALCQRYGVERLSLFGSATPKDFSPETSDVDCLVKFSKNKNNLADRFFDLIQDLEKICQRPVDIVFEDSIRNPIFREIVEQSKVLIFENF